MEDHQSAHSQGLNQRSKMEEIVPKMLAGEAQIRDNPEGSELDPADDDRSRCKKNPPSV